MSTAETGKPLQRSICRVHLAPTNHEEKLVQKGGSSRLKLTIVLDVPSKTWHDPLYKNETFAALRAPPWDSALSSAPFAPVLIPWFLPDSHAPSLSGCDTNPTISQVLRVATFLKMGCVCVCVCVYTCKYTQKHSQAVHTGPVQPPLGTISKQVNYSH